MTKEKKGDESRVCAFTLALISLYLSSLLVRQKKEQWMFCKTKYLLWIEDIILPQFELDCSQRNV